MTPSRCFPIHGHVAAVDPDRFWPRSALAREPPARSPASLFVPFGFCCRNWALRDSDETWCFSHEHWRGSRCVAVWSSSVRMARDTQNRLRVQNPSAKIQVSSNSEPRSHFSWPKCRTPPLRTSGLWPRSSARRLVERPPSTRKFDIRPSLYVTLKSADMLLRDLVGELHGVGDHGWAWAATSGRASAPEQGAARNGAATYRLRPKGAAKRRCRTRCRGLCPFRAHPGR